MLLTLSDFQGNYRLPSGAGPDLQPAVEQAEGALLREFFNERTALFIEAAPTLPPATTLRVGTQHLAAWRSVALAPVFAQLTLGVAGVGAQKAAQKGITQELGHILWLQGAERIAAYRKQLQEVQAKEWRAEVSVVATSPFAFQAPASLGAWIRVGTELYVFENGYMHLGQATAISPTLEVTTDITSAGTAPGGRAIVVLAYGLKLPNAL